MSCCETIRPLLSRHAEGELAPDEAIEVARHVPDCTACRILLARERRLAEMLATDLEDLPVGEDFVVAVMETLPKGPPPSRRRRRRGLELASLAGFTGLLGIVGSEVGPLPEWAWRTVGTLGAGLDATVVRIEAIAGGLRLVLETFYRAI
jgi:anti-sigma factor RsiW